MRLLLIVCFASILSSVAQAQVTSPAHQFMITLCAGYGGSPQQCYCWAHTAIGLLRPDDLQAVMRGYETPGSEYAMREANRRCFQ
jgi:hypothetical protein